MSSISEEEKVCHDIAVIDTETTTHNKIGKLKASAFCDENYIVYIASGYMNSEYVSVEELNRHDRTHLHTETGMVVGQNIKFDLHHIRKSNPEKVHEKLRTLKVWDIQLAEYLLTGQQSKWASLDEMSKKYGFEVKDSRVKDLWEAGVSTEDIDRDLIVPYVKQDVSNTRDIAALQMTEAYEKDMLPLILSQMDALMATCEMEYNGLYIDRDVLKNITIDCALEESLYGILLVDELELRFPKVPRENLNPSSNRQISALLFGGFIKYKEKEEVGKYKNGNIKYKTVEREDYFAGWCTPEDEWKTKSKGVYKVGDEILQKLLKIYSTRSVRSIIESILKYRYYSKQRSTYCEGLKNLIFEDGYIHHNLNHCATGTGRLASNNPNLQNVTNKGEVQIKKAFTSRFGCEGSIVEVDYSQLEVVCLAFLSDDPQLRQDIIDGVDVHAATGSVVYGKGTMTKEQRRVVKGVNFGLIYGGGAKTLAVQTGAQEGVVKRLIKAFYSRYPRVKYWQDGNIEAVAKSRVSGTTFTKLGLPAGVGTLKTVTGRQYKFIERDNEYRSAWNPEQTKFSATEIKNYPVQGFATGDVVPLMLGVLFRVIKANSEWDNKVLMINTVHDSVVFDVHDDYKEDAIKLIKDTLEDAPRYIKSTFDVDFDLPLKVEVTEGPNWQDQKEVIL